MPIVIPDQLPPRPPDFLIDRVTPGVRAETAEADRAAFDDSGKWSVRDLDAALAAVGRELADFECVLDFGCGCGRVTRWLSEVGRSIQLHGCDIDAEAIAWTSEHLPFANFAQTPTVPPLPYADETFDLILNHSVFTHLDEHYQDLWLPELRRVLRPGGLAVLSVHGNRAFEIAEGHMGSEPRRAAAWREALETRGMLFVPDDSYVGSAFPDYYHTTFHAPWYVFEHWSTWFDIRAYLPHADLGHQDMVIVQRPVEASSYIPIQVRAQSTEAIGDAHDGTLSESPRNIARLVAGVAARVQRAPAAPPPAPAEDRISPAVGLILNQMGERIARLETALATELSRHDSSDT
jgi:SAM-dependent methyltransferase